MPSVEEVQDKFKGLLTPEALETYIKWKNGEEVVIPLEKFKKGMFGAVEFVADRVVFSKDKKTMFIFSDDKKFVVNNISINNWITDNDKIKAFLLYSSDWIKILGRVYPIEYGMGNYYKRMIMVPEEIVHSKNSVKISKGESVVVIIDNLKKAHLILPGDIVYFSNLGGSQELFASWYSAFAVKKDGKIENVEKLKDGRVNDLEIDYRYLSSLLDLPKTQIYKEIIDLRIKAEGKILVREIDGEQRLVGLPSKAFISSYDADFLPLDPEKALKV